MSVGLAAPLTFVLFACVHIEQYMISLNRRNFHSHSREDLYRALGEVIGTRWKVSAQQGPIVN